MLNVHNAPIEEDGARKSHVIELVDDLLEQRLPAKNWIEAEVELNDDIQEILVEVVAYNERYAAVCLSAMKEKERLQELKFSYRVVTRASSLHAFSTCDADSDVGLQNHRYIVSPIAYS